MSKLIEQAGFVRVSKTILQPRLVMSIEAGPKTGKTHFALTTDREPIFYVNLNKGDEGMIDKFLDRDIYRMDLPRGRFLVDQLGNAKAAKEAEEAWKKFTKGYKKVLETGGTVILDTAGELWELLRLYRFDKLDQVKAHHYAPVNAEFESIFHLALDQPDLTLIAIHELKEQYIGEKSTGKMIRSGYKRMGHLAQVLIRMYKMGEQEDRVWGMEILECRHNPELEGTIWEDSMCNFPFLRDMVLA